MGTIINEENDIVIFLIVYFHFVQPRPRTTSPRTTNSHTTESSTAKVNSRLMESDIQLIVSPNLGTIFIFKNHALTKTWFLFLYILI